MSCQWGRLNVLVALTAFLMWGCGKPPEDPVTSEPAVGGQAQAAEGPGILEGRVRLQGPVPAPRVVDANKDVEHCGSASGEVQLVVPGADGALAGVAVEILRPRPPADWVKGNASRVFEIRQSGCVFQPPFQVVPDGSTVKVYNEDPVLHNVNTGDWNAAQPAGSKPIENVIRFGGRSLVRVNCNVHSWMECWVYVARSPFYAVTTADGRFQIRDVPSGTYQAVATHPVLGAQSVEVVIQSGKAVEQEFVLRKK
ncbi:MAG: hypothetical protein HYY18_22630 [Planctomycetes bacterium]|nr:hypothetical protein [Planctomycetota bacterium]